jgi:WD40 repeat protein
VAALSAALAVVLAAALVGAVAAVIRLGRERDAALASEERAIRAEKQVREKLWEADLARARAGRRSRRLGQRFDSLAALAEAAQIRFDPRLRDEATACLILPDMRPVGRLPDRKGSYWFDLDDAAAVYARTDRAGNAEVRRVADDALLARFAGRGRRAAALLRPDGRYLAVGEDGGGRLRLWRLDPAGEEPVLDLPAWMAWGYSPAGQFAVGAANGTVTLYDPETGRPLHRVNADPLPLFHPIRIDPSGTRFATYAKDVVRVRDLKTGAVQAELRNAKVVHDVSWHPSGRFLAAACNDGVIALWDVDARRIVRNFPEARSSGLYCEFSRRGDRLASSGWEGMFRVWEVSTGRQLFTLPGGMHWIGFGREDRLVARPAGDGLELWELTPGRDYRTFVHEPAPGKPVSPRSAVVNAALGLLVIGTDGGWGAWSLADGLERAFVPGRAVWGVAFESSGALVTHGADGTNRWPVRRDRANVRFGPPEPLPLPPTVNPLSQTPDGRFRAVAFARGAWVVSPDAPAGAWVGSGKDIRRVALTSDGKCVATGEFRGEKVVVWDVKSGRKVFEVANLGTPGFLALSPDDRWLACTGTLFRVWDVQARREVALIEEAAWRGEAAFSPDSRVLAVDTGLGEVRLLEPATGREYARLTDPNQDRVVPTFSSDGGLLIGVSEDSRAVRVWDLRAIRRGLAELGMDWELPELPPEPEPAITGPLRVEIVRR